jgi:hypothetical protein
MRAVLQQRCMMHWHVQRAALSARFGFDQPMECDVMRQDEVLFDVPDVTFVTAQLKRATRGQEDVAK